MASLLQKETMSGKVQMIYFDPPYGISFRSNMQADASSRNVVDNPKSVPYDLGTVQTFRDTYKNGIHSYLDNIYRIATHARELLHESGSFFMQIGSANVHRCAIVLDEVFGADNRVATITFAKSGSSAAKTLPETADYLLWYAKDIKSIKYHQLYEQIKRKEKIKLMGWSVMAELADGTIQKLTENEKNYPDKHLPNDTKLYSTLTLQSQGKAQTGRSDPYTWKGTEYKCREDNHWSISFDGLDRLDEIGRLVSANENAELRWKLYEDEMPGRKINNLWHKSMSPNDMHYIVETAESVIEQCILMTTDPGDLVLDPTCGSGTTAYIAEEWGRRWITIDSSTVAITLTRQRLTAGVFDYYLLQDSREGEIEEYNRQQKYDTSLVEPEMKPQYNLDPSKGFVYERVPYVSAATLGYDRPAPPTLLVNVPCCKKRSTVRISSPFTVESHSPYRYIDPETFLNGAGQKNAINAHKAIINALAVSGIKTKRDRIRVENIESHMIESGVITHLGDVDGEKAAIVIAPDDCTVPPVLINKAAEEAASMPSVKTLVVIAFAYETDAYSKKTEYRGKLTIHKAQANRDLQIGNLKDDLHNNAFVLIGEPDVKITPDKTDNDKIIVELKGYDTYEPSSRQTSGQTVSKKSKDVICWMIDTNYDGKSFFAHKIHFPDSDEDRQLKKIKDRLSSNIDKSLWEKMTSYVSAPFSRPKEGRIAVRIITKTHVEMSSVYEVPKA